MPQLQEPFAECKQLLGKVIFGSWINYKVGDIIQHTKEGWDGTIPLKIIGISNIVEFEKAMEIMRFPVNKRPYYYEVEAAD